MLSALAIRSSTGLCARLNCTRLQLEDRCQIPVGSLPLAINVEHSSTNHYSSSIADLIFPLVGERSVRPPPRACADGEPSHYCARAALRWYRSSAYLIVSFKQLFYFGFLIILCFFVFWKRVINNFLSWCRHLLVLT